MDGRQQGRRQPGRLVDHTGPVPRGNFVNHSQQAMMRSHLAPLPLDNLNAYMELARQGVMQGPAIRVPNLTTFGPAIPPSIPLLSSGQGFYTVESLQGATSVPLGISPLQQPHFVVPEGSRMMGFGPSHPRQGYDSGIGNMHVMMNPLLGHEMLASGHSQLGSSMVAITSRPQQPFMGHIISNGPMQHPHLPNLPLGFHPGRPSNTPGPYAWPQGRDLRPGWGWGRDGVPDMKGDWNHRPWDESRQVETLYAHSRRGRTKRNEQLLPPGRHSVSSGNDKKRKFSSALGPRGPGWCSLCELECSTVDMLQQHRQGKRHKRHLQKLEAYPDEVKGKTNSNSSAQVVTTEGDASTSASEYDTAIEPSDKAKVDVNSCRASLKMKILPPAFGLTEELSVASEVDQCSKPAEQGEVDDGGSKENVCDGQKDREILTRDAGDVVGNGAVSCLEHLQATAQVCPTAS